MVDIGDWGLGIGDWGLGIGDCAQSPIPNPQSPIPNPQSPFNLNYFIVHISNTIKFKTSIILFLKNNILSFKWREIYQMNPKKIIELKYI
jgi:hypothetical protein